MIAPIPDARAGKEPKPFAALSESASRAYPKKRLRKILCGDIPLYLLAYKNGIGTLIIPDTKIGIRTCSDNT